MIDQKKEVICVESCVDKKKYHSSEICVEICVDKKNSSREYV